MLSALREAKETLKPTETVERTLLPQQLKPADTEWVKTADGWREVAVTQDAGDATPTTLQVAVHEAHGQCFGFQSERNAWALPRRTFATQNAARPGYDTVDASEYVDEDTVLEAKLQQLARLMALSKCTVVYAGAGLSTAAGIDDYATHNKSAAADADKLRSPMCAQPTLSHRVLVGLYRTGRLHRVVQQNHDGLPQKAGLPQEGLNEIHGSLYAPDNPVIPMSGCLRTDLMLDLLECEQHADLVVAVGTSLAGMNADRLVHSASARASKGQSLGSVVIGLQRTTADAEQTLRIFAHSDRVFGRLAELLDGTAAHVPPARPKGEYFKPAVFDVVTPLHELSEGTGAECAGDADADPAVDPRYVLPRVGYDAMGRRDRDASRPTPTTLDLRIGATVAIPSGMHAGARGEVVGVDREGHVRCRMQLRLKPAKPFKAPMMMAVGLWWLQAAADACVQQLPVANLPSDGDTSAAAEELRTLVAAY